MKTYLLLIALEHVSTSIILRIKNKAASPTWALSLFTAHSETKSDQNKHLARGIGSRICANQWAGSSSIHFTAWSTFRTSYSPTYALISPAGKSPIFLFTYPPEPFLVRNISGGSRCYIPAWRKRPCCRSFEFPRTQI